MTRTCQQQIMKRSSEKQPNTRIKAINRKNALGSMARHDLFGFGLNMSKDLEVWDRYKTKKDLNTWDDLGAFPIQTKLAPDELAHLKVLSLKIRTAGKLKVEGHNRVDWANAIQWTLVRLAVLLHSSNGNTCLREKEAQNSNWTHCYQNFHTTQHANPA